MSRTTVFQSVFISQVALFALTKHERSKRAVFRCSWVFLRLPPYLNIHFQLLTHAHPMWRTLPRFGFGSGDLWDHLGRIWTPNLAKIYYFLFPSATTLIFESVHSTNRYISFKYSWSMGVQVVLDSLIMFLSPTVAPGAVGRSFVCWLKNKMKLITFLLDCNWGILSYCSVLHVKTFLPARQWSCRAEPCFDSSSG